MCVGTQLCSEINTLPIKVEDKSCALSFLLELLKWENTIELFSEIRKICNSLNNSYNKAFVKMNENNNKETGFIKCKLYCIADIVLMSGRNRHHQWKINIMSKFNTVIKLVNTQSTREKVKRVKYSFNSDLIVKRC